MLVAVTGRRVGGHNSTRGAAHGHAILSDRPHRYPTEMIAHPVRLYERFPPSYRGVQELMYEQEIVGSDETIRAKPATERGRSPTMTATECSTA